MHWGRDMPSAALQDIKVHVKLKLSALWAAVMFCYIYGDYFGLYVPGQLKGMLAGQGPVGTTSQSSLVPVAIMMAVPGVMVFLSLIMSPRLNRVVNMVLGTLYTAIMVITMPGAWIFYIVLGVIEIVLTLLIVGYAWKWPRENLPSSR
jgi:Family of unknown function (DUF6326)